MTKITEASLIGLMNKINDEIIEPNMEVTGEVHYLGLNFGPESWDFRFLDVSLCSSEEAYGSIEEVEKELLINLYSLVDSLATLRKAKEN